MKQYHNTTIVDNASGRAANGTGSIGTDSSTASTALNLYERPREKLQRQGTQALSLAELFQIIIGSGTATVSSARIAGQLAALAKAAPKGTLLAYTSLVSIKGVGPAKACLILAALELGKRTCTSSSSSGPSSMAGGGYG